MARVQHVHMSFAHLLSAHESLDRFFVFFARSSYAGGIFAFFPARKCSKMHAKLFYSKKMTELARSELDLVSQPRYLPLVSIGGLLGQWPGSWELHFLHCEVTRNSAEQNRAVFA